MTQPSQKVFKKFIKPSSPICKRLFDFPDPVVTKYMLQEMDKSETHRLKVMWNFDAKRLHTAGTEAEKLGEKHDTDPMSSKKPRYEWEYQDREKVPNFYTRPFRRHHSEARCLKNACGKPQPTSVQKLFYGSFDKPSPLRNRDENASPGKPSSVRRVSYKKIPKFTSPPKIMSGELDPFLVRRVTALRIPLPTSSQIAEPLPINSQTVATLPLPTSQSEETQITQSSGEIKNMKISNQRKTPNQPELAPVPLSTTSKTPTSRQLFTPKTGNKRVAQERLSKQPKITEFMPSSKKAKLTTLFQTLPFPKESDLPVNSKNFATANSVSV